jgi:exosortase/archaeosortase family protein
MLELLLGRVSLTTPLHGVLLPRKFIQSGSLPVRRFLLLVLGLTLTAIAADQFAAPVLRTTSPLWATAAFLVLVWRRDELPSNPGPGPFERTLSIIRLAFFFTAHFVLIQHARMLTSMLVPVAGSHTASGLLVAAWKLSVLVPTILLLPLSRLKGLATAYKHEGMAALVVFVTFSPWRAMEAVWPWYGQLLGRFVYTLASFFVAGLGYVKDLTPTITGPDLDITIVQACSGITGLELFGYLFGVVTILDWNRLWKWRGLLAYFAGLFAVLLGNALRITSFVVFGNRGFADFVLRFHVSAGWIFFSVVFLVYLSLTYRWMLNKGNSAPALSK